MNDCYCCDFREGDEVRFKGGVDVFSVRGHAKTQPKIIIEVDGEAVYVPVSCLELVRRAEMTTSAKLEMAMNRLRTLLGRSPRCHGRPSTIPADEIIELLQRLDR
jgi:hypothetical protein